ncbi:LysR family transcriptional regulator [Actinomadura graeca]|uniref:LysR family transcriptional regulator n=1 Tax=Actinomadura graeca TaxID=2750812 RepID=A0ABX8QS64_9ACTN|nr:LysR substrate-binding domain-containing protein [Actinomadura graeca]QXJ21236.1 LysR family transcriptional regulator [Actinomadura graeca]
MDLLQLRYFQAVARREHLSRAAEEMHVGQPSMSRTIARLERELGVPLFDRQGRQVRLNRFGSAFLKRVDRALVELDEARQELSDEAGLENGSVSVAAETLLTLTGPLSRFSAEYPEVSVRLRQADADAMVRQLADREVDLCVASQRLAGPSLRSVELLREEVLLAVPLAHPLAGRERVGIGDVTEEPFVTTRPGHWQRTLLERLFTGTGTKPKITCEGDETGAIQDLVSAGLGIGLIPVTARRAAAGGPVAWLHVDAPGCARVLTMVWREDAYLPMAARRFRDVAVSLLRSRRS